MPRYPAMRFVLLLLLTALVILIQPASTSPDRRRYKVGDQIPLFANKVHPLNNPCYAYQYFVFPFCPPGSPVTNKKKSFEEVCEGDCFNNTQYDLKFKVDKTGEILCEKHLTRVEVAKFRYAVKNKFEFQMFYNNIPIRGKIGIVQGTAGRTENSKLKYYLIKHISFYPLYFKNQVKNIFLLSEFDSAVDITKDVRIKVNFTYSVFWKKLKVDSDDSLYQDETSKEKYGWPTEQQSSRDIVWSFIYLAAIMICWVRVLVVTLSNLSNHITRYIFGDVEVALGLLKWKQIHGDACRCPSNLSLLGAVLGIGTQLLILISSLFVLVFKGLLHPCERNVLFAYLLTIYSFTSFVSGYTATSFQSRFTEIGWKECLFQTGFLYFVPVLITGLFINTIADVTYQVIDQPDFRTVLLILLIWALSTIWFLSMGAKMGVSSRSNYQATCVTIRIPRGISQISWYMKTPAQMFFGGLLPFMTIFQEMDNIYASLWNMKICGALSSMVMSCIAVITQTIIVGMSFTCFQLSKEDYQLWWRSVLRGGSTAIFMFVYGIYFHARADPDGFMKPLIFLFYNACIFYALFLSLGTIGFHASLLIFRCMCRGDLKYD